MSKASDRRLGRKVFDNATADSGHIGTGIASVIVYGKWNPDEPGRKFGDYSDRDTREFGGPALRKTGGTGLHDLLFGDDGR